METKMAKTISHNNPDIITENGFEAKLYRKVAFKIIPFLMIC